MAITTAACAVFAETVVSRLIRSRFAPQCRTALSVSRRVHPLGRSGLVLRWDGQGYAILNTYWKNRYFKCSLFSIVLFKGIT